MKIKLNEITTDPAVMIREGTDEDTIQRYMDNFDALPPIIVYQTDHKYLLADGFHRWAAAERLGKLDIEAEVRIGSENEAKEFAIYANLKHGRPLSVDEYRNAVRRLNILHPDWGRDRLAKAIQRSHHFVVTVLHSDEVRRGTAVPLDNGVAEIIHSAPKESWRDIAQAADEQDWTYDKTIEKVREIKAQPERIDKILAIEPPQPRTSYEPEPPDIQGLVYTLNDAFAELAEARVDKELTRELLSPFAADIYTWRDAVNELIKILEE